MDFSPTPEQRAIQQLAREFAEAEIAPQAAQWDRDHRFPQEFYDAVHPTAVNTRKMIERLFP